jgi:hypothetical protein
MTHPCYLVPVSSNLHWWFSSDVNDNCPDKKYTVSIKSEFKGKQIHKFHEKQRSKFSERIREDFNYLLQRVPIIGRFAAHATTNYWVGGIFKRTENCAV